MINVKLDGIYCKECNTLHPTLFWHKKYNDYELNREENYHKMMIKHFPNIEYTYKDNLYIKNLEETKELNECVICKTLTYFKHISTNNYVCSDECKYKDK